MRFNINMRRFKLKKQIISNSKKERARSQYFVGFFFLMSLELNKCPICLRTAVDYRQIELYSRFAQFIHFPKCQLCFGVPPTHNTPEHRNSKEEVKTLIDLVNYHLERTDRMSYYQPVNWRAITFALQVHQTRFTTLKPIVIIEKLGFPIINYEKLQEQLSSLNQSRIFKLDDVQEEIRHVQLHLRLEQNLANNQIGIEEEQYLIQTGAQKNLKELEQEHQELKNEPNSEKAKEEIKDNENENKKDSPRRKNFSKTLTTLSISNIKRKLKQQRLKSQEENREKKEKKKIKKTLQKKEKKVRTRRKNKNQESKNLTTSKEKKKRKADKKLLKTCQQCQQNEPSLKCCTSNKQNNQKMTSSVTKLIQQSPNEQQAISENQKKDAEQIQINNTEPLNSKELCLNNGDNSNPYSDEIIYIKFRYPKKITSDQSEIPNEAKVEQIIRCFSNEQSTENEKQKNDLRIFQYLQ